jgi:STE24 endopeptidase
MRVERLLIYPLLLIAFQLSGGAIALRKRLETRTQPNLARRLQWMAPGFNFIRNYIPYDWRRRLSGRDLQIIMLYVVAFSLGIFLLYLPFNFYRGFVLAHQFGLSTQTALGWLSDWLKNVLINLVIDGLLWSGLYGLMRLLPRRWPLLGGALLVLAAFGLTLLNPIIITPLFYQVRQLDDPELEARILTLADRAGMPVDAVQVIDASSKTTQVNAYVTSFGETQRIVLFDTLLAGYTPDEVEVVLAHELGHWYYRHVLLGLMATGAVGWLGLFVLRWLLNRVWQPLGWRGPADVAGLPLVLAVIALATMLSLPVQNLLSRFGENQADEFALSVSRKPEAFMGLFEQLVEQNLTVVDPPAWEKFIFYSHPPVVERLQTAERYLQEK